MKRRTLLQGVAALVAVNPFARWNVAAQTSGAAPALTAANLAALRALADVVLPGALGDKGRDAAVQAFRAWIDNYKENAETGGGYGNAQLGRPTRPSPARRYPDQFAALDEAARTAGGATFAALTIDKRREAVEAMLNAPPRVANLPQRPNGANVIADFAGFYFASSAARDLCYKAAIRRDACRGLAGSGQPPPPLGGG